MNDDTPPRRTLRGVLALIVGGGGLIAIFAVVLYAQAQRHRTDDKGCPFASTKPPVTVLVVDQSDPFESADRHLIRNVTSTWLDHARQFDRLIVVVPRTDDPFETDIRFDGCAPQNPDTANAWLMTRSRLAAPWTSYTDRLDASLRRIEDERQAPRTPLIETVVAVAREPQFRATKQREIIIISDLMQNSEAVDFYRSVPSLDQLGRAGLRDLPELSGSHAELLQAARHHGPRIRPEAATFWRAWLESQGATVDMRAE